jgi:hypothetical protein
MIIQPGSGPKQFVLWNFGFQRNNTQKTTHVELILGALTTNNHNPWCDMVIVTSLQQFCRSSQVITEAAANVMQST